MRRALLPLAIACVLVVPVVQASPIYCVQTLRTDHTLATPLVTYYVNTRAIDDFPDDPILMEETNGVAGFQHYARAWDHSRCLDVDTDRYVI